jgi:hypothetical protein
VSKTTLSLICNNKYPAGTTKIEERAKEVYGDTNKECSILGLISLAQCVETFARSRLIGMKAGNPETLRLYKTCSICRMGETG